MNEQENKDKQFSFIITIPRLKSLFKISSLENDLITQIHNLSQANDNKGWTMCKPWLAAEHAITVNGLKKIIQRLQYRGLIKQVAKGVYKASQEFGITYTSLRRDMSVKGAHLTVVRDIKEGMSKAQ